MHKKSIKRSNTWCITFEEKYTFVNYESALKEVFYELQTASKWFIK